MTDYLKAAHLIEQKAASLPSDSRRRAHLLAIAATTRAEAARRAGLQAAARPDVAPGSPDPGVGQE